MAPAQLESVELNDESLWEQHPERALAIAHETARLLIGGGVNGSGGDAYERLVDFLEEDGLDVLARLWSSAEPSSLPGALWRLVLMRHQLVERSDVVASLVEIGMAQLKTIDPVVAGLGEPVSAWGVQSVLDQILSGSFHGELVPALRRASALARLVSAGLLHWPEVNGAEVKATLSALHWEELSRALALSARREEKGELS